MPVDVTQDPAAESVSVQEAVTRLRAAKDIALRAANNSKLKLSERNQASLTANSISDEIIRILVDDFADRTAEYKDIADVMPELIKPLQGAKKTSTGHRQHFTRGKPNSQRARSCISDCVKICSVRSKEARWR